MASESVGRTDGTSREQYREIAPDCPTTSVSTTMMGSWEKGVFALASRQGHPKNCMTDRSSYVTLPYSRIMRGTSESALTGKSTKIGTAAGLLDSCESRNIGQVWWGGVYEHH